MRWEDVVVLVLMIKLSTQNIEQDAKNLRKFLDKCESDTKDNEQILNILCTSRTAEDRAALAEKYSNITKNDINQKLTARFGGLFQTLITTLMTPIEQVYAKELHNSFSFFFNDYTCLVEVLCTNDDLDAIKDAYKTAFGSKLESDVDKYTSGDFNVLMKALLTEHRDNSTTNERDSIRLLQQGELGRGDKKLSTFVNIFSTRTLNNLKKIFTRYAELSGTDIQDSVEKLFTKNVKDGLVALIFAVRNKPKYFAQRLFETMVGLGTDERGLIRIVVTQAEHMKAIKSEFRNKFNDELGNYVSDDTSGEFRKCLLKLIDG